MGPREAIERILTLIKAALVCNDLDRVHVLLREMQALAERAVGKNGARRGRILLEASSFLDD